MWVKRLLPWGQAGSVDQGSLEFALKQYSLFEGLSPALLTKLSPVLQVKDFKDQEIVCHCPNAFHDAFLLLSGVVAVTRKIGDFLHTVQLEKTGAVFNVGPLVGSEKEQAGARALGSVQILAMDSSRLSQLLPGEAELGYKFIRNICRLALDQHQRQMERYIAGEAK